jgi:RNA polymerase sigma-70 factor (ECF subfamily)
LLLEGEATVTELEELVERASRNDAQAFAELVTRYRRLVYAISMSQVDDPAEAEDLTQEVFVRAHRDLPHLREPEKFVLWLSQVARNSCLMWVRRKRPVSEPLEAISEQADPAVQARFRQAELADILKGVLGRVSPKSREVLALHYLAGFTEEETAGALGLSEATVKSRLHEGRKQARRELRPLVKELLALEMRSEELAERILSRCGSRGCICPETLTEGR